uniref:Uncharacterized protein n=1 Tax=Arundo donax TaxID=35708 RepID=A0A0A9H1D6_ARUDO
MLLLVNLFRMIRLVFYLLGSILDQEMENL